jgi:pimeloyl-ACP methyl ester carboxylesterase
MRVFIPWAKRLNLLFGALPPLLFVCVKFQSMNDMDVALRTQQLSKVFSYEKRTALHDSRREIIPCRFAQQEGAGEIQAFQRGLQTVEFCPLTDDCIQENKSFAYPVFAPERRGRHEEAIILLHGLNERSWEKYLAWAEYLAASTGKPVILFPIAFHMNRTPEQWSNPRAVSPWVARRRQAIEGLGNSTFVNLALSSRISRHPLRFYASGRESAYNLCQLVHEIKDGRHPLFREDAAVNLFAYSIGALLAQVLLLANPDSIFSASRLFMFCGGSIFNHMDGNARDILDKEAFARLQAYFNNDFIQRRELPATFRNDSLEQAFKAMISPNVLKDFRESFFTKASHRIRAISLRKDVVIPTAGVIKALGAASSRIVEEIDFPYPYTHQIPFPSTPKVAPSLINNAFQTVFGRAAAFL